MDKDTLLLKRPGNVPKYGEAKRSKPAGPVPPDKRQVPTYSQHKEEAVQSFADLAISLSNDSIFPQIRSIHINGTIHMAMSEIVDDLKVEYKIFKNVPQVYINEFKQELTQNLHGIRKGLMVWHWTKLYELYRGNNTVKSDWGRLEKICKSNGFTISINESQVPNVGFSEEVKPCHNTNTAEWLFRECMQFIIKIILQNDIKKCPEQTYRSYRSIDDDIKLSHQCELEIEEIAHEDVSAKKLLQQINVLRTFKPNSESSLFKIIEIAESRILFSIIHHNHEMLSLFHLNLFLYEVRNHFMKIRRTKGNYTLPHLQLLNQFISISSKKWCRTIYCFITNSTMSQSEEMVLEISSGKKSSHPCSVPSNNVQDSQQKVHDLSKISVSSLAQELRIDQLCSEDLATSVSNHTIFTQISSIFIKWNNTQVTNHIFFEASEECLKTKKIRRLPHYYVDKFKEDVQRILNNLNKDVSVWHWSKMYELYRRHCDLACDKKRFMTLWMQMHNDRKDPPFSPMVGTDVTLTHCIPDITSTWEDVFSIIFSNAKRQEKFTQYLNINTITATLFEQCVQLIIETIQQKSNPQLKIKDAVRIYQHCRTPDDDIELLHKCEMEIADKACKDTSANVLIGHLNFWQNYKITTKSTFFEIIQLRESMIVRHIMTTYKNVSRFHINLLLCEIRCNLTRHFRFKKYKNLSPKRSLELFSENTNINLYCNIFCQITQMMPLQNEIFQASDNIHKEHSGTKFSVVRLPPKETQTSDTIHKEHSGTESSVVRLTPKENQASDTIHKEHSGTESSIVRLPPKGTQTSDTIHKEHSGSKSSVVRLPSTMITMHKNELTLEVEELRNVNLEHVAKTDSVEIATINYAHDEGIGNGTSLPITLTKENNADEQNKDLKEGDCTIKPERMDQDEETEEMHLENESINIKSELINPEEEITENVNSDTKYVSLDHIFDNNNTELGQDHCDLTSHREGEHSQNCTGDPSNKAPVLTSQNAEIPEVQEIISNPDSTLRQTEKEESIKISVKKLIDEYLESMLPEIQKRMISSIGQDQQLLQHFGLQQPKIAFKLVKFTARTILPDLIKLVEVLKNYNAVSIKMHKLMLTSIFADTKFWKQLIDLRSVTIDGMTMDIDLAEETLHGDQNLISVTPDVLYLYLTINKYNKETPMNEGVELRNTMVHQKYPDNPFGYDNTVSFEEGSVYSETVTQNNNDLLTVSHVVDHAKDRSLTKNNEDKNIENFETVTPNNDNRQTVSSVVLVDNAKDRSLTKNNEDKNIEKVQTVTQNNEDRNNNENPHNVFLEENKSDEESLSNESVCENNENSLNIAHEKNDHPKNNEENSHSVFKEENKSDEESLSNKSGCKNIENSLDNVHEEDFDHLINSLDTELENLLSTMIEPEDFEME